MLEDIPQPKRDLAALDDIGRRARIEIEYHFSWALNVLGQGERGMQLQRCQVCQPDQGGEIVGQNVVDGAMGSVAPDWGRFHPFRLVHWSVLLEERLPVHAIGITLPSQRSSGQMRQDCRSN